MAIIIMLKVYEIKQGILIKLIVLNPFINFFPVYIIYNNQDQIPNLPDNQRSATQRCELKADNVGYHFGQFL
jgi:hypothetical protein